MRAGLLSIFAASLALGAGAARAETISGHKIKLASLVFERASKFYAADKKDKRALGALIAECEDAQARYLVSSPDGKADNPHISGYRYRRTPR